MLLILTKHRQLGAVAIASDKNLSVVAAIWFILQLKGDRLRKKPTCKFLDTNTTSIGDSWR